MCARRHSCWRGRGGGGKGGALWPSPHLQPWRLLLSHQGGRRVQSSAHCLRPSVVRQPGLRASASAWGPDPAHLPRPGKALGGLAGPPPRTALQWLGGALAL